MAKERRGILRRNRYSELRLCHFTPREARVLAESRRDAPAVKLLKQERMERWNRFEKIAARKIATGQWRRSEVYEKWTQNLSRMYSRKHWRVKEGPKGGQEDLGPVGSVNPWASYRDAEKRVGGRRHKGYKSPWEAKQVKSGKTSLQKGLVFIQKRERSPRTKDSAQIRLWIAQKDEAIRQAKGRRKQQLMIERNRLERML